MKSKIIILVLVIAVLASGGFFVLKNINSQKASHTDQSSLTMGTSPNEGLSREVENLVTGKHPVMENLAADPTIVNAVSEANVKNKDLTDADIADLDGKWTKSASDDPWIKSFLINAVANTLSDFQEKNLGFVEIFVTDGRGLNVGQTNKTSDFYQADEEWWVDAFNNGAGKTYHGELEYDESAKSESIPVFAPVKDENGRTIGVIKAVLSIIVLRQEL